MNETLDTDVPAGGPRGLNTLFGRWKNQAVMISPNPLIQRHHPHHSHAEIIPPSYGICAGHKFPFVLGNILYIFPCVCHQEIKLKKKKKEREIKLTTALHKATWFNCCLYAMPDFSFRSESMIRSGPFIFQKYIYPLETMYRIHMQNLN